MSTVPSYGSLQNNSNGEYRCNHATQLESSYSSPNCLINFQLQSDGTYGIKNVGNNQYYQCKITTMVDTITGTCQKWRLLYISGNQYYVQNVSNNEFMTSHASQLSSSAGPNEIWNIVERSN
ncbi:hypothetical protein SAMN04515674_101115 [Pseudarcicella hirudinis]|uniref:Ricin B lectin domain-containing protein n=1 Tax=Pseudarcicella hirudinis TaxID=1079859 RepID=A0A1I5M3Z2_9BACT|nr:hypothetical protein [Pseudarcicella hirudinis]SFP04203.1 hypothetical protein SAMN04515674_101115 [Pseudarcicella hirudinis]